MEMILLNLNIISACFPLVKGSAPILRPLIFLQKSQSQQYFGLHRHHWRGRGRQVDLFPLEHPLGHNERAQLLLPASLRVGTCCLCPPCSGVSRLHSWGFLTLLSSPHAAPDLVTSYHTEKAEFGLQAKLFLILAFLILKARGNFVFLGHLSISLMN